MTTRDRVRLESNERVDKPDLEALQLGAHLAGRYDLRGVLFGTDNSDQTIALSTWSLATSGSELTVTAGRALAGEVMADTTIEQCAVVGEDGEATQILDFVGFPADTYGVYVRADYSSGASGSRLFWNSATESEDAAAIDTRMVSGWRVVASVGSPGDEYTLVGRAEWDGAAFIQVNYQAKHYWEGSLSAVGAEASNVWGDGANDRDADRATFGVQSLYRAFALIRRQIKDIVGAATGHWGSAVPVSLTTTKAHIDQTADPHGPAPTWSGKPVFDGGIEVNGQVDATGSGAYVEVGSPSDIRFTESTGAQVIPVGGAHAYIVDADPYSYTNVVDGGAARMVATGDGLVLFVPLHVPVDAVLSEVRLTAYWANQSGAAASAQLTVYAQDFALVPVLDQLGSTTVDDSDVAGSGAGYAVAVVDGLSSTGSRLRGHFASIYLANNGNTAKIAFCVLVAKYEYDHPVA